ncbi:hypothetical protein ElyMa_001305700 [Elysia marginata]|uniref:EF-hand domain-containing protein n=1 Tax=Elysia marginata TaxID=1093978 RepID=A0AAV4IEE1_9GAST|nr:hypothetical protein ElyMa_001305700 [Elysia marginata]
MAKPDTESPYVGQGETVGGWGEEEEAALRRYLCLGPGEKSITRHRFTAPEMAASLGLTTQELEIIFSALDADSDDVITLDELLEQWPQGAEEAGAGTDVAGLCSEQESSPLDPLDRSLSVVAEGGASICSEDAETHGDVHQALMATFHQSEDPHNLELMLKTAAEDINRNKDRGSEYNRARRRSSLLLHILDSRASPVPLLTSTPSSSASSHAVAGSQTAETHKTELLFSASSPCASPTISPATSPPVQPPAILPSLSPRLLVDMYPHPSRSTPGEETEADPWPANSSESPPSHTSTSSSDNCVLGDSSAILSAPTSPTSLTSMTSPTQKAVKCDHSCVHPSKLTLTGLMTSSYQSSVGHSSCPVSGGCKETHTHVRRKLRGAGMPITDYKVPLVADISLQHIIPKDTSQNQNVEISTSSDSLSPVTPLLANQSPDFAEQDGTDTRQGLLRPPSGLDSRQSRWSAHQYSAIDGTTPTIRKFRPKSPRPEKAGSRKLLPARGPSTWEPIDLELGHLSKTRFVLATTETPHVGWLFPVYRLSSFFSLGVLHIE